LSVQMSERPSKERPAHCSGLIYKGLPNTSPGSVKAFGDSLSGASDPGRFHFSYRQSVNLREQATMMRGGVYFHKWQYSETAGCYRCIISVLDQEMHDEISQVEAYLWSTRSRCDQF